MSDLLTEICATARKAICATGVFSSQITSSTYQSIAVVPVHRIFFHYLLALWCNLFPLTDLLLPLSSFFSLLSSYLLFLLHCLSISFPYFHSTFPHACILSTSIQIIKLWLWRKPRNHPGRSIYFTHEEAEVQKDCDFLNITWFIPELGTRRQNRWHPAHSLPIMASRIISTWVTAVFHYSHILIIAPVCQEQYDVAQLFT